MPLPSGGRRQMSLEEECRYRWLCPRVDVALDTDVEVAVRADVALVLFTGRPGALATATSPDQAIRTRRHRLQLLQIRDKITQMSKIAAADIHTDNTNLGNRLAALQVHEQIRQKSC